MASRKWMEWTLISFFIAKDGQVYRGRPENTIGVHTKSYKNISLGICMQGGTMK